MSLKLSLALITAAAVGGSLFTAMTGPQSGSQSSLQSSANNARQNRLMASSSLADPAAVAEQIRASQIGTDYRTTSSTEKSEAPAEAAPHVIEQAQVTQAQPQAPVTPPVSAETQSAEPDLTALRYFATRGDNARLQAEISRLRSLYPNWTPPSDPLAIPLNRDGQLDTMWQLYSEGRYAEVRRAITERQAADANWQPPQDLLDRLNVAETRARLTNASDLKQYATVISLAAATPSLLNCSDVDALWRVAEAFVNTDRVQRGVDAYSYILQNCTDPQQRVATVQKASAILPAASFKPLLAFERDGEFAPLRDDLARRFVAEANSKPGMNAEPDDLERLRGLAEREQKPTDTLLLGWYALRHDNMTDAEKWFRASRQKEDTVSASQGLALALINRNASAEAEEVMYHWRNESEEAGAVYLASTANLLAGDPPPTVAPAVLQRVATTILEKKYVPTAQQLGWYARAFNQPQTAARWFETALQWKPDDEPSAYGLVITRQQLNDRAGVAQIQRTWAGRSDRIANLGMLNARQVAQPTIPVAPVAPAVQYQQPPQPAPRYVEQPQPAQQVYAAEPAPRVVARSEPRRVQQSEGRTTRRACSATGDPAGLAPQAALTRGWCLMELNRPLEAAEAFQVALSSNNNDTREDASYGQSLAYMRLGLTNKAAVAATKAPQSRARSAELQVSILADRANSAFNSGRYREAIVFLDQRALIQPETQDLMVLRAYAMMNLGNAKDAYNLFEAVAQTGNRDAIRGMNDAQAAMN